MITKTELRALIKEIKASIEDDFRAYEDDTCPGILLTIAHSEDGKDWTYQTGDLQYSGNAYDLPVWVSQGIYGDTNVRTLADDFYAEIKNELEGYD